MRKFKLLLAIALFVVGSLPGISDASALLFLIPGIAGLAYLK